MRILLNLLPPEQKEALSRRFRFRFFTWQTVLVALVEIFYVGILLGIFLILSYQVKTREQEDATFDERSSDAKTLIEYEEKFKKVNDATLLVARFTKNHLQWTNLFLLLDKVTPEGVVLVDVSSRDYTITVTGQAQVRDNFLSFEENLKRADCVSDVKVPISNLFSEKEVEFQIEFKIKRECLIRAPQ
ncbi:MAG: PilN domain-containing protein [Candidatus Moraniibacteriota bacterium]